MKLFGSLQMWTASRKKGLSLAGCETLQDLRDMCVISTPKDLQHFLSPFRLFIPTIVGDLQAIERIAYEFCEDEARNGVTYVEARYSPHFLLPLDVPPTFEALCEVVRAVDRGFARGENDHRVKARHVLCTLVGADMARDVLKLCEHFRGEGVVGIDMAALAKEDFSTYEEVKEECDEVQIFQEARRLGIHRTVHAGESGPAEMVRRALEIYGAERIGHGYHVLDDLQLYSKCLKEKTHLETCPISSFLTGSVPLSVEKHPVVRFAEDDANYSISTDDPTITGAYLQENYDLLWRWGMSEAHFTRANLNAAESCFLPEHEKRQLVKQLKNIFVDGNSKEEATQDLPFKATAHTRLDLTYALN
ncbi:adenosine deaminase-like isoform X2 [Bacillus rossius redtenbacheri]|uniref:adenosine deaminase-like isoform X2 n=1 Tax=Bacillus rossius redtenbacheri TaxID=93214 RepID=UPI002FDC94EF